MAPETMTRRQFIALCGAAGCAALAGCAAPGLTTTSRTAEPGRMDEAAPVLRIDSNGDSVPMTLADLRAQPGDGPALGAWPRVPTRDAVNASSGRPYVVTVYKVPLRSLQAAAAKRGYNTGQYAVQDLHEPDHAVLAYFAKCTHLGCTVGWHGGRGVDYDTDGHPDGQILCPCHLGAFDVFDLAKNEPGTPPTRPLDVLRLRIGPWTNDKGIRYDEAIVGLEWIPQTDYRDADRQGDGATFRLQPNA